MHGGKDKSELTEEDLVSLEAGLPNLLKHVSNMKTIYGVPVVVAINRFPSDTVKEIELVENKCRELGVNVVLSGSRICSCRDLRKRR